MPLKLRIGKRDADGNDVNVADIDNPSFIPSVGDQVLYADITNGIDAQGTVMERWVTLSAGSPRDTVEVVSVRLG